MDAENLEWLECLKRDDVAMRSFKKYLEYRILQYQAEQNKVIVESHAKALQINGKMEALQDLAAFVGINEIEERQNVLRQEKRHFGRQYESGDTGRRGPKTA